jgi:pyridoxine kinase
LPIISAAGVEASVLPTSLLSTHTAFPKFTFLDLTDEIQKISDVFSELSIDFDAIYTGYLGSAEQVRLVEEFIKTHKKEKTAVVIDPAMADNGKLYHGFAPDFPSLMTKLVRGADLIIPNLTEASLMLGIPYVEEYGEEYIKDVLRRLCALGCKRAALTGVSFDSEKIGVYAYNSEDGSYFSYFNERLSKSFHGTGDVFASATLGAYMRGLSLEESLKIAVDFTLECMRLTLRDGSARFYGVNFEEALPMYISRILNA